MNKKKLIELVKSMIETDFVLEKNGVSNLQGEIAGMSRVLKILEDQELAQELYKIYCEIN